MASIDLIPGAVLGLREGLEAFLIIGIILKYISKIGRDDLRRPVAGGLVTGIAGSLLIGFLLWLSVRFLHTSQDATAKIWEAGASLTGLFLLSGFIYWMIRHGSSIVQEVHRDVETHLSAAGLFVLSTVMVLREGAEIALFAYASAEQRTYLTGILIGVLGAALLSWLIYHSLVKVNLHLLFSITLGYLILQAGYLFGYGVHELLSALKDTGTLDPGSPLFTKVYDFQGTVLDHKNGLAGLPLNVLFGWYSRPEWVQFLLQYGYTMSIGSIWVLNQKKEAVKK